MTDERRHDDEEIQAETVRRLLADFIRTRLQQDDVTHTALAMVVESRTKPGMKSLRNVFGGDVREVLGEFTPGERVIILREADFWKLVLERRDEDGAGDRIPNDAARDGAGTPRA